LASEYRPTTKIGQKQKSARNKHQPNKLGDQTWQDKCQPNTKIRQQQKSANRNQLKTKSVENKISQKQKSATNKNQPPTKISHQQKSVNHKNRSTKLGEQNQPTEISSRMSRAKQTQKPAQEY